MEPEFSYDQRDLIQEAHCSGSGGVVRAYMLVFGGIVLETSEEEIFKNSFCISAMPRMN